MTLVSNNINVNVLTLNNINLSNVKLSEGNQIFDSGSIQGLVMNNATFSNITSNDEGDATSRILFINSWDLNSASTLTIDTISISNSSMNFVIFGSLSNVSPSAKNLAINNFEYKDSYIETQRKLVSTESIEINGDLSISLENISFSNVSFFTVGSLIYFGHQLPNSLQLMSLTLANIIAGRLHVQSTNQQNTDLSTQVSISDSTFDSINDQFSSLITTEQGGRLNVTNSSFTNIYTFEEGAVVFAGQTGTEVNFIDTVFQNNSAVTGALFHIESESVVRCYNCTITSNVAYSGTISDVINDGYFQFYDSEIYNNYAYEVPLASISDSGVTSVIDNCQIYSNEDLSDTWITEITGTCNKLCFVPADLALYFNTSDTIALSSSPDDSLFQVILSSLTIQNSTHIHNQNSIVNIFLSDLVVTDSIFEHISTTSSNFRITSSTFILQNTMFRNVSSNIEAELLLINLDSTTTIGSCNYTESNSDFVSNRNSNITITNLLAEKVDTKSNLIEISNSDYVDVNGVQAVDVTIASSYMIIITYSNNVQLSNFVISDANKAILRIYTSNVNTIQNFAIQNCPQGIFIDESNIDMIKNNTYLDNGNSDLHHGGAILLQNSIALMQNNTFINNTSIRGAAIAFLCTSMTMCTLNVTQNTFDSNQAIRSGGVIYYDYNRPTLSNNIYLNNQAQYGSVIASYPVKIIMNGSSTDSISIDNVGSGIQYDSQLHLALVDYDNQTMLLDSQDSITINPLNFSESSIFGTNTGLLQNGVSSFTDLIFENQPGATDVVFVSSSKAIDSTKINEVFGSNISDNYIHVSFRWCKPGEIDTQTGTCRE